MTSWDALGPFQPGPGGMPPYLAGREAEQALFRTLLKRLEDRIPLPSEVVLYGPRGNGKTVLLGWLEDEAMSRAKVDTVVLLPSEIPDGGRLAELLLPRSWWERLTPQEVAVAGISWRPGGAGGPPPSVDAVLAARARKAPLLVVMDEAHTLETGVGRALLNASQRVRRRHPFLLVLAGTPNLRGHLGGMGASFWGRAQQLRIGRLDDRAAGEAFLRPFESEGIPVEPEALAEIRRLSHGYPYFVQLLGQAVWGRAVPDGRPERVTAATVEAARPEFERTRGNYYLERFEELKKRRLLGVGRSVAMAFGRTELLDESRLAAAIRAGLPDSDDDDAADRAETALSDLGFIWGSDATPGWEPGIPSLMDYIVKFVPEARSG